ncbi:hypothetical protein A7982_13100 [Minicystis rosea]|nr:hypothetical protein A7982_13100 [Minicystis rosea]
MRCIVVSSFALVACSSAPAAVPPPPPGPIAATTTAAEIAPAIAASAAPTIAPSAEPAAPPPVPTIEVTLQREIEAPVSALALDAPPHAAALGEDTAWIHDAHGWRSTKLPGSVIKDRPPRLDIFYGRDDRVRVVGTRVTARGPQSIYLRWKPQGFISGAREVGRLGNDDGALVAILGTKDPEIVCRPATLCIIKRRSGWTMIPAPADIEQVTLGDDVGWGVGGRTLYHLGARFEAAGNQGPWQHADALFALRDRAYVLETEAARVHVFDGKAWQTSPSPIAHPRALWGSSASALWLVGDGLAFFDGASWRVATKARGPFKAVLGRNADDVWIGGASGVFRISASARP